MWLLNHFLQPLSGKTFRQASAHTDNGERLDVHTRGFWNTCQYAYFDVRAFHPNAPSNRSRSLPAVHEDEIWPACTWNRTWPLNPIYSLNLRWYGKRSTNLLHMPGRLAVSETWYGTQHSHRMAKMQAVFRHPQICSHIHLRGYNIFAV